MKYPIVALFSLLVFGCDTTHNTPDPSKHYFIRYYGTDGNQEAVDMVVNNDGTFMLLGNSQRVPGEGNPRQIYLNKVNGDGIVLWEKFYDGPNLLAKDLEPTEGGYVILGEQNTIETGTDISIMTIDGEGNQLKSGFFSYSGNSNEIGVSITPLVNGTLPAGFIVAGHTNFDSVGFVKETALTVRFDQNCILFGDNWSESLGALEDDYAVKVVQVGELNSDDPKANPFLFFGYSNSDPKDKKFNYWATVSNDYGGGQGIIQGIIDGSPTNTDKRLASVTPINILPGLQRSLLAGIASDGGSNDKIFLAVLNNINASGFTPTTLDISLGKIPSQNQSLQKVSAYPGRSQEYIVAANSLISGNADILLTKVDTDGNLVWDTPVILGGSGTDYQVAVHELGDGRIMIFGTMEIGDDRQKKMALLKMNHLGEFRD